jgi:hypothetical protein
MIRAKRRSHAAAENGLGGLRAGSRRLRGQGKLHRTDRSEIIREEVHDALTELSRARVAGGASPDAGLAR